MRSSALWALYAIYDNAVLPVMFVVVTMFMYLRTATGGAHKSGAR